MKSHSLLHIVGRHQYKCVYRTTLPQPSYTYILTIIRTFNNENGCRDDKQKKGKNKVGMNGMRTPSE